MSNRKKICSERRTKGEPTRDLLGLGGLAGFNQLARPSCSECGAPVTWMTGEEAAARGIDLREVLEIMGVAAIAGRDVWVCRSCDEFGVMGPTEVG